MYDMQMQYGGDDAGEEQDGPTVTPPSVVMSDDFEDSYSGNLEGQPANNALGGSGSWTWTRFEGNSAHMGADGIGNVIIIGGSWIRVGFPSVVTAQKQGARAVARIPTDGMLTFEIRGSTSSGAQLKIKFPQGSKPVVYLWTPGGSQLVLTDFANVVPANTDIVVYAYAEDLPTTGIRVVVGLGAEEVTKDILVSDLAAIDSHRLAANTYAGLATDLGTQGATVRSYEWLQWPL